MLKICVFRENRRVESDPFVMVAFTYCTMKQNGILNSSNTFVDLTNYVTGYIIFDLVRKMKLPSVILALKISAKYVSLDS
jgi:hypothetical protein